MLLIGRWCPFHNGHKRLVDSFLKIKKPVCIAVRDTDEEYLPQHRVAMIEAVYEEEVKNGMVKVIIIPDIEGVAIGRGVGYYYVELPNVIKLISGTEIRRLGKLDNVPEKAVEVIKQLGYPADYPPAKGKRYTGGF